MDISPLMGGSQNSKPPETERKPALEYTAQADSPLVSGEVKLTIGEDSLSITALFDAAQLLYAEMTALSFTDYTVTIKTDSGNFVFSRMGSWGRPFYDALLDAYNKKVQKALFIEGPPILTANGEYRYMEGSQAGSGSALLRVYDNCICLLPPDLDARRIPLCFATDMEKGDFDLTLRLDSNESYTFSKLGYDTAPFSDAVEKQIRALREKTLAAVRELDPSLSAAQASAIAKLMPEGAAAPLGKLGEIAPSFVAALEAKIADSRAADTYKEFQSLCDTSQIMVGFKKNNASGGKGAEVAGGLTGMPGCATGGDNPLGALGGVLGGGSSEDAVTKPDPYMLWLIVPSPDGNACAVEFAGDTGDAAATFVYYTRGPRKVTDFVGRGGAAERSSFSPQGGNEPSEACDDDGGDFDTFVWQLNRALEATCFKREVIRLADEELMKPEYQNCRMAVQRNTTLQFIRSCFAGRVIHTGTWKRNLLELWSAQSHISVESPTGRFCTSCGAESPAGVKFCGACGTKL